MKKKILFTILLSIMAVMVAMNVSAEVTMTVEREAYEDVEGVYRFYMDVTDETSDVYKALQLKVSFDNTVIQPVSYEDGEIPEFTTSDGAVLPIETAYYTKGKKTYYSSYASTPEWNFDGAKSSLQIDSYYPDFETYPFAPDGYTMFEFYFKYVDGKTEDDLTSNSFKIEYMHYVADASSYYYGHEDSSKNNVVLVNNAVPEAPVVEPIYVPVLAGDKVYLQDGTVATVAEAGDYEVPATVGYVAVNTGKTAQKTYYVDGTAATLVHTNGIVSTEENDLRGPDEKSSVADDTSGLRFLMNHNPTNRTATGHEITEVGVLMTVESNKVIADIGQETIDNLKVGNVGTFVKSGYALGNGYDRAFKTENDTNWVISAVMYGIKLNAANVQVNIVCRPFYKVGETYIYGETMKATLYDVAKSIKEGGYIGCSDELKAYVDEIVTLVDGVDTPVDEGEVLIDISSLYTIVG